MSTKEESHAKVERAISYVKGKSYDRQKNMWHNMSDSP